jgi:AraC family transcriptional regulator, ethanolamine operon transcriptional activator
VSCGSNGPSSQQESAMPTQTFSSFDAFFEANRHASLRAMLLGTDRGTWVLTNLIVNELGVQFGQAEGKAVVEGASKLGGLTIFLQTQGTASFLGNGRRLDERTLMVAGPGDEFCLAADASPRRWCSLYIPNEKLGARDAQTTTAPGPMRGVFQLPPQRIERFRSAIEQLDGAVQRAPAAFDSAAAQEATEEKLAEEIRNVLAMPSEVEHPLGRNAVPRQQIIRMSMDFVEQHSGEYLSVERLAAAAGVSQRTLRDAFRGYFGAAPVQYLNRRTLHLVRNALKASDPSMVTVTEIATQFGVWELGRFARDYRSLFGELPSKTLHH